MRAMRLRENRRALAQGGVSPGGVRRLRPRRRLHGPGQDKPSGWAPRAPEAFYPPAVVCPYFFPGQIGSALLTRPVI